MSSHFYSADALRSRLGLGMHDPRAAFLAAVDLYRQDPQFCLPPQVRDIVARRGRGTRIVLLGRSDFGANIIGSAARSQVLNVVDDFRSHRGEQFHGIDIVSTDRFLDMAARDPDILAINACRFDYSKRFFDDLCRSKGIACINFEQAVRAFGLNDSIDYRVADWGGVIAARCEDYLALEGRMADPYSVETLYAVLTFHLSCNPEWFLNIARPYSTLYFRSGLFTLGEHERLVDCGASIGESTTALIGVTQGRFDRSWMIEPDRLNVATLQGFLRKHAGAAYADRLSLHPVAVGEHAAQVPFRHVGNHGGVVLQDGPQSEYVQVEPIDAIVDDRATIIKMDVEGFELPALKGAERTIRDARPKLMVSAYHRSTDLLEIPAWVDAVAPGYRIGLRHHTEDRWDTCLYFF